MKPKDLQLAKDVEVALVPPSVADRLKVVAHQADGLTAAKETLRILLLVLQDEGLVDNWQVDDISVPQHKACQVHWQEPGHILVKNLRIHFDA